MTLYEVLASLEGAQVAVSRSLDMIRSLIGSVQPVTESPGPPVDPNKWLAEEIVKAAKRKPRFKVPLLRTPRGKRKHTEAREKRSRVAAEGWVARKKKANPTTTSLPFNDAVTQVLRGAGRPMHIDELETEMRKIGWTTSSGNIPSLFGVMLPRVSGIVKVDKGTWQWKNGNGKK